jgi:P-type Cu+ transporter
MTRGTFRMETQATTAASAVLRERAEALRTEGQTVMFLVVDGRFAGLIAVADPIKASSFEAIEQLKKDGMTVVMVTGNNHTAAATIASKLGIDSEADLLPGRKADLIKSLQALGKIVAMAGDGVNDAPALAQANVGIAMGTGTDITIAAGGIVLVSGELRGIVKARKLSHKTMGNIFVRIFFCLLLQRRWCAHRCRCFLSPVWIASNPMIAVAAMSFSSISVIANSLRLRTAKL